MLALQGGVREHVAALQANGVQPVPVRRPADLAGLEGIVLPGGESTTIGKLLGIFGLLEPLREALAEGLPAYGSCAGMILLADRLTDPATDLSGNPQPTLGGLDILVRRNAFGRQRDSFEADLHFKGIAGLPSSAGLEQPDTLRAVFIRAPLVEKTGADVQVLAEVPGPVARIVAVRSGQLLATSFHPEVTGERRVHELFISMIRGEA